MPSVRDTRTQLQQTLDSLEDIADGFPAMAAHSATAAADTAVAITLAAPAAGTQHALAGVYWSYSGAPTAGQLTITAGGSTVFDLDLGTSAGPGMYEFRPALLGGDAAEVVITLGAGGAGVIGKLNVHGGEL